MNPDGALLEAVLFLENEPLDVAALVRISGLTTEAVRAALADLEQLYARPDHGLELVQIGGGYTFAPKRALWESLKPRYSKRNEGKLSRAALETLSIIAYSQPTTRQEIEGIRGVAADGMIKLLLARNIIREVGKKDAPGRPIQYGTTKDFLKLFRLGSIADLPKMGETDQEKFEADE